MVGGEESANHLLSVGVSGLQQEPFERCSSRGLQCYQHLLPALDLHHRGSEGVRGGGALPGDAVDRFQVPTGGVRRPNRETRSPWGEVGE